MGGARFKPRQAADYTECGGRSRLSLAYERDEITICDQLLVAEHDVGCVQHAIGESPFVVVPGKHLDQVAFDSRQR